MIGLVVLEIDRVSLTRLRPDESSYISQRGPLIISTTSLQHKLTNLLSTLCMVQLDRKGVDPFMSIIVECNIQIVITTRRRVACV